MLLPHCLMLKGAKPFLIKRTQIFHGTLSNTNTSTVSAKHDNAFLSKSLGSVTICQSSSGLLTLMPTLNLKSEGSISCYSNSTSFRGTTANLGTRSSLIRLTRLLWQNKIKRINQDRTHSNDSHTDEKDMLTTSFLHKDYKQQAPKGRKRHCMLA